MPSSTFCFCILSQHKLDIVHCDLKCSNMVLDKRGPEGVLKIIDFGESMIVDPKEMYDHSVGTIHFVMFAHVFMLSFSVLYVHCKHSGSSVRVSSSSHHILHSTTI